MEFKNKEILINNESLLMDIQGAFSARYPFLKIDFLETDKTTKAVKGTKIDPSTSLKKIINCVCVLCVFCVVLCVVLLCCVVL